MRLIGLFFACLLVAAPSLAAVTQSLNETPETESETLDYDRAYDTRMTIPVHINGQGPFTFIVDTGSERTVVSSELAERLVLEPSEDVRLGTLFDVQIVPTVIIDSLDVGRRTMNGIQAPALPRRNLGADGILGIDALEDQRLMFDFERRQMTFSRLRMARTMDMRNDMIIVRAQTRLGRLVLANVRFDGMRIFAIVDTGSAVSVGNLMLRDRLIRRGRVDPTQTYQLTSVTGITREINYTYADKITLGGVEMRELPVAFADAELFRQLDLIDRPAMLLGMNALRPFDRISIDFNSRRLQFHLSGMSSGMLARTRTPYREAAG